MVHYYEIEIDSRFYWHPWYILYSTCPSDESQTSFIGFESNLIWKACLAAGSRITFYTFYMQVYTCIDLKLVQHKIIYNCKYINCTYYIHYYTV